MSAEPSTNGGGTLGGLELAAKESELQAAKKEAKKPAAPARRSNSFSRRKKPTSTEGAADTAGATTEEKAKPTFKETAQADPLREALQKEAVELFDAGDFDAAGEKWYCLAEAANHAGDLVQEASAMQNMGTSLVNMEQLEQGFACYDRALKLAEQADNAGAQIDALLSLKWLFHEVGALSNALRCLEEVKELYMREGHMHQMAQLLLEMAVLHRAQEDFPAAVEKYELALQASREHAGPGQPPVQHIMLELGHVVVEVDGIEAALPILAEALAEAEAAQDELVELQIYHDTAILYIRIHREEEAMAALQQCITRARAIGEPVEGAEPNCHAMEMEGRGCVELAPLLLRCGKLEEAQALAARGIELAEMLEIDEATAMCHTSLSEVLLVRGDSSEALRHLHIARDIFRRLARDHQSILQQRRARMGTSGADDADLLDHFDQHAQKTYENIAIAIMQSRDTSAPEAALEALAAVDEGRGGCISALLALGAPPAPAEPEAEDGAGPELKPPEPPLEPSEIAELVRELYGEGAAADAGAIVYWSMGQANPAAAPSAEGGGATPLIVGSPEVWAWVLTADGAVTLHRGKAVAPDGRPVTELVWDVAEKLRLAADGECTRAPEGLHPEQSAQLRAKFADSTEIGPELALLSQLLLEPLLPLLPAGAPLTLLPHSFLNFIPFGALPLPDGQPLITRHALVHAPSLAALRHLGQRERLARAHPDADALVLGAPQVADLGIAPHPGCEAEVAAVAASLGAPAELALSGSEATLPALLSRLQQPLRVVHISCPCTPRAALVLAAAPAPPQPEGGLQELDADGKPVEGADSPAPAAAPSAEERVLFAEQVGGLWLRSHPEVVLGGSHSGNGPVSQDGVLGLPRAFLAAGARCVLASTFDAVDAPSAKLLQEYHAARAAGAPPSRALQRAVLALREAEGSRWDHPVYWAGFFLTCADLAA